MGISVNTSQQQVTASVNDETVSATVSAGFGASGAAGAAATIAVGTVTTGAAGSQASVTNVGSSSAAVLNFTIPAGATGPQGATGPAGTTTWAGITDKPSEITNLSTALSGINTALDGKANAADFDQSLQTTDSVTFAGVSVDNLLYVGGDAEFAGDVDFTGADVAGLNYAAVSHQHSASDVSSGTFDIARIPTGTTSTTVSLGNHTHSQLHDRSHAITSSSDHTATAWRLFYSNGSGVITELTLGSSGQALLSNGASAAPSWGSAGSNSASDLTTGTLAAARIGAHASTHQTGGTDAVTNVVVSPSQITGNQNDYSPGTGDIVRLSSDAARNITGITAGGSGDVRVLVNVGSFTITLVHQSTSSTAANRFLVSFGADYLLAANAAAVIVYDATTSRWRVI